MKEKIPMKKNEDDILSKHRRVLERGNKDVLHEWVIKNNYHVLPHEILRGRSKGKTAIINEILKEQIYSYI
jgi:hypothetical protein